MVNKYSVKADGNKKLSTNFKVSEFKCRDNSDEVLIDLDTVDIIQKIRDNFKKSVTVVSAYRTPSYNKSISGAKASQHMYGKACDIQIDGIAPRKIAEYAENLNVKGIGLYEYSGLYGSQGFVHVDTRATRSRWFQDKPTGGSVSVKGFFAPVEKKYVALRNLNLRDKPNLLTKSFGWIPTGSKLTILHTKGNFVCVKFGNLEGYVWKNYVK